MLWNWLRQRTTSTHRPTAARRRAFKPRLEQLEEILTPAGFLVTTLSDAVEHTGMSLRDAITAANANADADTITFDASLNGGTIHLEQGELVIAKELTISGPGANLLTISGGNVTRVFLVHDGVPYNGIPVTISGLTITEGHGHGTYQWGGGVYNMENLTLDQVTIRDCAASSGGGVASKGTLTIQRSLIAYNTAYDWYGGGILANSGSMYAGSVTITNSTITGNTAKYSAGGLSALYIETVNISGSTIADNTDRGGNGGVTVSDASFVTMTDNIIANNISHTGPNTSTPSDLWLGYLRQFSASNNLVKAQPLGIQNGVDGNIVGIDPKLGNLADNGGPTLTMALLAGSPAINAGSTSTSNDQRNMAIEGIRDLGAYEAHAPIDISLSNATIVENAGFDALVGKLTGQDPDKLAGTTLTLVPDVLDNNRFYIEDGHLRAVASFDFETQASYSVRVRATDLSGLTFDKDFNITVLNQPPTIASPLPSTRYKAVKNTTLKVNAAAGLLRGFDAEGAPLTAVLVTPRVVPQGKLTVKADGSFTFVPKRNFTGKFTFEVRAMDAEGVFSPVLQFSITIR